MRTRMSEKWRKAKRHQQLLENIEKGVNYKCAPE